ncbi:hypothetical protein SH661x_000083 [Planctomicrobium sp. SH661]|uniref:hypothetical protein n=1 Tax=Planctomicrobium sp. SH661 TaxID=3448124 RepID=UPI003F5C03C2
MAKMNVKKLAADHAEKFVFGVFALIVVMALAGTNWTPYEGTPREITQRVIEGKKKLKANTWPEEEMAKYKIADEAAPANIVYDRLRKEYSPSLVEMSGRMVVDPFKGNEPVTEPILKPAEELIASSARVFINMFDESKMTPETEQESMLAEKDVDDDSDRPDELRRNANTAASGMPGMAGMEGPRSYGAMQFEAMMTAPGGPLSGGALSGEPGMSGPEVQTLKGEGYHFVSVRAVFPLREQITHYAEAINKSFHYAAATFDIRDFELERQTAQPGDDPWSGPWEPVDMKMAEDILSKADGFDAEVVNPMITNAVITMPLPMRISGRWDKQATHPRIEKFTLSDSQIALEAEMQRKLLQEAVNQQKEMDASTVKRGGFSRLTLDPRQLNQDMLGVGMFESPGMGAMGRGPMGGALSGSMGMGGPGGMPGATNRTRGNTATVDPVQKLISDMAKGATNKTEEEERIRKWIQSLVSAEGELLLFRYLDFNVEPGKTYRYRVRFILANPNYGKRIADAGGLNHVVEGETRETPWSNVTRPVTVEKDVKYFLTEIREQSSRVLPTVYLDVYEWAQQHGTVINALLDLRFGQQMKQEKETLVIDPAKMINGKQKFEFKATDFLVDATEDMKIDEAFHENVDDGTGIKLPVGTRGRLPNTPKVLMASVDHELKYLNPDRVRKEHKSQKDYVKLQTELFEYLKTPETNAGDGALAELGLLGSEGPAMSQGPKGRGPRSQLRVRSEATSQGPPGMGGKPVPGRSPRP